MLPCDPTKHPAGYGPIRGAPEAFANGGAPTLPAPWFGAGEPEGPAGPSALSGKPGVGTVMQPLRRRWPMILFLSFLGGALAAVLAWFLVPGQYSMEMLLEFERPPRGADDGPFDVFHFKRAQAALLRSNAVLHEVVRKPEVRELNGVRSQADAAAWLQKNLVTDDLLEPTILRVTFSGDDPAEVQTFLSEVRKEYEAAFARAERVQVVARSRHLRESYRACAATLWAKRQALAKKREALGLDEPEIMIVRYQAALKRLEDARAQRLPIRLRLKGDEAQLARDRAKLRTPDDLEIAGADVEGELRGAVVIGEKRNAYGHENRYLEQPL
jgi:hypothetical protein